MTEIPRPDPDALLAALKREEEKETRARLKIFFGMAAGVGKTYAMLEAARKARAEGVDVVVGYVETHGRAETEALLQGLEILPPRWAEYRGAKLREFDLDAALLRRPTLILVDELAHTNVPGSRHAKRWQDVEELLLSGIDVYTTVNVQHLESLNDVVAQITYVRVHETVPDLIFERADEVELVDLPPDDLLQRLKEGKVYVPNRQQRRWKIFSAKAISSAARSGAASYRRAGTGANANLSPRSRYYHHLADGRTHFGLHRAQPFLGAAGARGAPACQQLARGMDRHICGNAGVCAPFRNRSRAAAPASALGGKPRRQNRHPQRAAHERRNRQLCAPPEYQQNRRGQTRAITLARSFIRLDCERHRAP
jgi:hypothetical protein